MGQVKTPCLEPHCPNFATYRGRCEEHSRERDASINRAGKKVYGTQRWQVTRRQKLLLDPICQHPDCTRLADTVHHIKDISEGGEQWALSNLESLCAMHHSQITRRRQAA